MSTNLVEPFEYITEFLPDDIPLEMAKVEGGEFLMSSDEIAEEKPINNVVVSDFYIGKFPITNVQFAAFLNDYGSEKVKNGKYKGKLMIEEYKWGVKKSGEKWKTMEGFDFNPVVHVTWYGANVFCNWLSRVTSRIFRLPSELEWEYAARGGINCSKFYYAGSNNLKEVGWFISNSHNQTKPVGLKLPNILNIYDLCGNVNELCEDLWNERYPDAPEYNDRHVVRGGGWSYSEESCQVSDRDRIGVDVMWDAVGFRVTCNS